VYVVKPQSSRASSAEAFVVGLGFISVGANLRVMSESISSLKTIKEEKEDKEDKTQ
jgi:hypothetical protein